MKDLSSEFTDFVNMIDSVIKYSNILHYDVSDLINKLFVMSYEIITKLNSDLTKEFMIALRYGIGDFAGAMCETEYWDLCKLAKINCLTIRYCRKCCNMFWVLCKVVLTKILFLDFSGGLENILITTVKRTTPNFTNFDIMFPECNKEILSKIIWSGLNGIDNKFGKDEKREINADLFYRNVIRLSHSEPRHLNETDRDNLVCGYNKQFLESVCDKIMKFLTSEEISQIKPKEFFPWTGKSICGVKPTSDYYKFCKENNIYFVSGMSGTTFELAAYLIMLLRPTTTKEIKTMLIFFLNFHVLRGTHSAYEVILAFDALSFFFDLDLIKDIFSSVRHNGVILYSTDLCEKIFKN
jgi:hypothetical protein